MPNNAKRERDPLRTGVFGLVLVVCVVLIAFGYSGLPFWPQGKTYDAYFTDAGGITPGNAVYVSGFKVGKVSVGGPGRRQRQGRPSAWTATSPSVTSRWPRSAPTPSSVSARSR